MTDNNKLPESKYDLNGKLIKNNFKNAFFYLYFTLFIIYVLFISLNYYFNGIIFLSLEFLRDLLPLCVLILCMIFHKKIAKIQRENNLKFRDVKGSNFKDWIDFWVLFFVLGLVFWYFYNIYLSLQ